MEKLKTRLYNSMPCEYEGAGCQTDAPCANHLEVQQLSSNVLKLIKQHETEARIDELERFKFNRSMNAGEISLVNNRIAQLKHDSRGSDV